VTIFSPSSTCYFYVNGFLIGSNATASTGLSASSGALLVIGESPTASVLQPFAGYIDDFRIYNRALGSGEIALLAGCTTGITTAPTSGLAAYYPFENSTAESSGNSGPALTTTGSVSYVTGVVGTKAVYLANEGNVLATSTKATNRLSATMTLANQATVSCWFYMTKAPQASGQFSFLWSYGTTTVRCADVGFNYVSSTQAQLFGSVQGAAVGNNTVNINTWYNAVLVIAFNGTFMFYVNGSLIGTYAAGTNASGTLLLGDSTTTSVYPFAGYIDDFRIYNRALTPPEIAYLAGNAIYPSIQTYNQAAYFPFDGALTDASGNGVTLTPTGTMQYVSGVTGTQALYLQNTSGSVASRYVSGTFTFSSSLSISMWVYWNDFLTGIGQNSMIFNTTIGTILSNSIWIGEYTNYVQAGFYGGNAIGNFTPKIQTWYHIAVTYINGSLSLYINGSFNASTTGTLAQNGFMLGNSGTNDTRAFAGYIDDFRIFNTALTQSQVTALYYGSANIASRSTPLLNYTPSAAVLYQQSIEGTNIADLAFGTSIASSVSASCWIKNNTAAAQTFTMSLNNGVASGRSILYTTPSISAGSWSRIAFTVPGDVLGTWAINNGLGLNLAIALGANNTNAVSTAGSWLTDAYYTESGVQSYGSATGVFGLQDNAIFVTGMQFERGTLATPFEFRPFGTELQMCQRYYQKSYNYSQSPGTPSSLVGMFGGFSTVTSFMWTITFQPNLRVSPTLFKVYGPWTGVVDNYNLSGSLTNYGIAYSTIGERFGIVFASANGVANNYYYIQYAADSEL